MSLRGDGRWRELDRNDALNRVARAIFECAPRTTTAEYLPLSVRYQMAARALEYLGAGTKPVEVSS